MSQSRFGGLILDLDGTLVDSRLDFDGMRAGIGVPENKGILEHIESLPEGEARERALAVIDRFEDEGARAADFYPGAADFLAAAERIGVPLAILTRNSRRNATLTMERLGIRVSRLIAREDAAPKPDPEGVHLILADWGIRAEAALFVGDYLYDIEAGRRAGAQTALYLTEPELPSYAALATYVVRSFSELGEIVFS